MERADGVKDGFVQPAFGQNGEGRDNVSGATCMTIPPAPRTPCLVVNDSTRLAQLFSANGTTIRSGLAVGITAAPPACTLTFAPNMEAAAHDDRFFYVVTSRGRTGSIAQPDSTFLVALLAFGLDNSGIRDLAAVADGILILAGPGRGLKARASLFHWNDTTGQLRQLGVIAEPANGNGEALLVLQQDPEFFRFLVMFDGVENGGPLEYFVSR